MMVHSSLMKNILAYQFGSSKKEIMRQEIVIEVPLECAECKKKAMNIIAKAEGTRVTSVTFPATERNRVVIVGERVDAAGVTKCLRKKFKYAKLVSLTEMVEEG